MENDGYEITLDLTQRTFRVARVHERPPESLWDKLRRRRTVVQRETLGVFNANLLEFNYERRTNAPSSFSLSLSGKDAIHSLLTRTTA